jgi:phospholipid/cholesterol/gamma-HCH transport system substrate-binding protein
VRLGFRRNVRTSTVIGLAVFVAASLAMLGWLAVRIAGFSPFSSQRVYHVELVSAMGLQPGDPVKIAGVQVGRVTAVYLKRAQAMADIAVNPSVRLTYGTRVGIVWRNVLGQMALYLWPQSGAKPLPPGSVLPTSSNLPTADLARLFGSLAPFLRALDPRYVNEFVVSLSQALANETEQVRELVAKGSDLASSLAAQDAEIGATIDEFDQVMSALAARRQDISSLISRLDSLSSTLAANDDLLSHVVGNLAQMLADVAQVSEQTHSSFVSLISSLDSVANNLAARRDELAPMIVSLSKLFATFSDISSSGQWLSIKVVYSCLANGLNCTYYEETAPESQPSLGSGQALPGIFSPLLGGGS